VQNYIKQRTVNLQSALFAPGVVNEAQFPEPVHEKAHSGTSGADHFRQGLLTDSGNHGLRHAFLTKLCDKKKNTGQA
jgi:hypothetical protein